MVKHGIEGSASEGYLSDGTDSEHLLSQVHDNAKRSISLRLHTTDYGKIRMIARRLRVRDSDVFRFLVRIALAQVSPLYNDKMRGRDLFPVLLEFARDITKHFGLDARRLEMAVNAGETAPENKVDLQDIEFLTMAELPDRAVFKRLQETLNRKVDPFSLNESLHDYLRAKYGSGGGESGQATSKSS